MAGQAVFFGSLLFLLGPLFYLLGDASHRSPTAFIPSLFGILIIVCGLAAKTPARRKAAMHGAAGFALLGLIGSLRGLKNWPLILSGQSQNLSNSANLAGWSTLLMFVICLVFLFLCARSFSAARRAA